MAIISPYPARALRTVALMASAGSLGLEVFAQDSELAGKVEVGAQYVSEDAFRFGQYNGLEDEGLYPVLDFSLKQRPQWDSPENRYWYLEGHNLGLESRSLEFGAGSDSNQHFTASYREITSHWSDSGRTIFINDGSTDLTLPANWTPGTSTGSMTALNGPLDTVTEALKRQRLTLDYRIMAATDWTIEANYRHEIKDGKQVRYGVIGNSGGNPRAVALPSPVEYSVDEFGLQAGYAGKSYYFQVGYQLSLFSNDNRSQLWQNPYSAIAGWDPAAGYPSGQGAIALEPDNQYQMLFSRGNLRLSPKATLNGSVHYARLRQDEDFLPYTVNPALAVGTPLPRNSLDGAIDIWRLQLGYHHYLTPKLSLRINADHENRDNDTPRDLYLTVGGDSQDQPDSSSSRARYNLPYSRRETTAEVGVRYRLPERSTVSAKYKFRRTDQDFSEVSGSDENHLDLTFNKRHSQQLQWRVSYALELRDPSSYRGARPYLQSHTEAFLSNEPENERFENHPLLRKYYLAERERRKFDGWLNWTPHKHFGASLSMSQSRDHYDKSVLGLENATMQSINLDLSVLNQEKFDWTTFFSYQRYEADQMGHSFRGFAVTADTANQQRRWSHESTDRIKTIGSTLTVYNLAPRTEMKIDYLVSYATSELETGTGAALSSQPIPDQGDKMIRIAGEFVHHATAAMDVMFKLAHETYDATNFNYDSVAPNTMANVIALGRDTQTYSVNWFSLSLRYQF